MHQYITVCKICRKLINIKSESELNIENIKCGDCLKLNPQEEHNQIIKELKLVLNDHHMAQVIRLVELYIDDTVSGKFELEINLK